MACLIEKGAGFRQHLVVGQGPGEDPRSIAQQRIGQGVLVLGPHQEIAIIGRALIRQTLDRKAGWVGDHLLGKRLGIRPTIGGGLHLNGACLQIKTCKNPSQFSGIQCSDCGLNAGEPVSLCLSGYSVSAGKSQRNHLAGRRANAHGPPHGVFHAPAAAIL